MALKTAGFIPIPPGKQPGFDHADVYRRAAPATSRLYVAHTGADRIDVIDCLSNSYLRFLPDASGVAGILIDNEQNLLFSSHRGCARVSIYRCSDETLLGRVEVGDRPNGLANDSVRRHLLRPPYRIVSGQSDEWRLLFFVRLAIELLTADSQAADGAGFSYSRRDPKSKFLSFTSNGIVSISAAPSRLQLSSVHADRVREHIPGAAKAFPVLSLRPGSPERNEAMKKANCKRVNCVIYQRIAEIQLGDTDRQCARYALRDAEAIADAVIWVKQRIASLARCCRNSASSTRRGQP
jgi:hypothetical protein